MTALRSPIRSALRAGIASPFGGGGSNRGLALDADPIFRGRVLDADPLNGRYQSWDNDPAYADRVGRYRAGGPYMALTDKQFAQIFSFSRASGATDFDAYGLLNEIAADNIRQGYDPATLLPVGWLIEGASTNLVRNPRGEGGGIGSFPTYWSFVPAGGLTPSVVGTGIEDGMPYADIRWTGTANGSVVRHSFEGNNFVAAALNQVWTHSVYVRLVAGSISDITFQVEIREFNGDVQTGLGGKVFTPTSTMQRVAYTRTLTGETTTVIQPTIRLGPTNGVPYEFTLRIACPQLEQNHFASSLILPPVGAPAAATRAADDLSITGSQFAQMFGANAAQQGCVVAEFVLSALPASGTSATVVHLDVGGTNTDRRWLQVDSAGSADHLVATNADITSIGAGTGLAPGVVYRLGARWNGPNIAACLNGGTVNSRSDGVVPSLQPDSFRIGRRYNLATPLNGRVRIVRALAYAPSDAEFQALCTPGA